MKVNNERSYKFINLIKTNQNIEQIEKELRSILLIANYILKVRLLKKFMINEVCVFIRYRISSKN